MPDIGYLHRGDERKIAENMQYNQFVPYTDRLDYLAPLANNVAYACAVEKLMGWTLPPRGQAIRVLCCELARISSHLLGVGCYAMDVGAMTVSSTPSRARKIYNLCEQLTGARFTTSYTRVGGMTRDLPPGFTDGAKFIDEFLPVLDEVDKPAHPQQDLPRPHEGCRRHQPRGRDRLRLTGPNLRASGVDHDLRKATRTSATSSTISTSPIGTGGRLLRPLPRAHGGNAPVVRILRRCSMPVRPDLYVEDPKNILPPKEKVLMSMEELIHHFIIATQGIDAPAGEVYFGAENPKGELGFYIHSKGGGVPYRLKIRSPSFATSASSPNCCPAT
jgi:NADH-quinone oxidoreductase subunit D